MNIAQNFFIKNQIKISPQIISHLVEKSKKDRVNLKNELEKIKIFYQKKSSIQFSDILKLTTSAENYDVSELTDQSLAKNKKKVVNIMNENISTTEGNILILKSFLYKLKRLLKLKKKIEIEKNHDLVISSFKPTIFWKDKDIIKKQLNTLSVNDIKSFIKKINELELLIKKNSSLSNKITNNFILETVERPSSLI
jgi:DNA polymerase-3 subunit delta